MSDLLKPNGKDQLHPQAGRDRLTVNQLLSVTSPPSDFDLAELARLRIRYRGFPGSRDLQRDLDRILSAWNLTEDQLFERTRQIHATATVYRRDNTQQEDWL